MATLNARIEHLEQQAHQPVGNPVETAWLESLSTDDLRFLHDLAGRQARQPTGAPLVDLDADERRRLDALETSYAAFLATRQAA